MVPQLLHDGRTFSLRQAQEGLVPGEVAEEDAGEGELLPDQKAQLVTELVEGSFLPQPATPDAQHVDARLFGQAEELGIVFSPGPPWQSVYRHPVGPADEQGLAVDDKGPGGSCSSMDSKLDSAEAKGGDQGI